LTGAAHRSLGSHTVLWRIDRRGLHRRWLPQYGTPLAFAGRYVAVNTTASDNSGVAAVDTRSGHLVRSLGGARVRGTGAAVSTRAGASAATPPATEKEMGGRELPAGRLVGTVPSSGLVWEVAVGPEGKEVSEYDGHGAIWDVRARRKLAP